MYKALVIGCGNIGALYDLENDNVTTHVKALHLDNRFSLAVFDTDQELARSISERYTCGMISEISVSALANFDCVSICAPTGTHFGYLAKVFEAKNKVVICEKPVSNDDAELNELKKLYSTGKSKCMVNYIRRFQPAYHELKDTIDRIAMHEKMTHIAVRYQRGFINNCSHAFDLIEFLLNEPITFTEIQKHNVVKDHFESDPTLSMQAMWHHTNVNIMGLSDVQFSHFEIDLYFTSHKIKISDAGQTIQVYQAERSAGFLQALKVQDQLTREHCLENYMIPVIEHAYKLLANETEQDNFLQAATLNQRMLTYLHN